MLQHFQELQVSEDKSKTKSDFSVAENVKNGKSFLLVAYEKQVNTNVLLRIEKVIGIK